MDDTLSLAQALIQRPSITPDDANCQQLLKERLEPLGFVCEDYSAGNVTNTYFKLDRGGPLFWFVGHTDVVPTGPEESWTYPPFSATIEDGKLYGRGAADMKGAIAAIVVAIRRFLQANLESKGSIGLVITSDEEGPATHGVKHMVEHFQQSQEIPTWTLVGEPSSSKKLGDTIKIGRRGSLTANITFEGKQGHIAYPHLADNPIHKALPGMHALCRHSWDQGNDHFPPTSFQIASIHGGASASNVIPDVVQVQCNFRFSTENTVEALIQKTQALLDEHSTQYSIEWTLNGQPFFTQPGQMITAMQSAIEVTTSIKPELSTSGGTSDGRFIGPLGGEIIEFGPCNATIHQVNEYVECDDLLSLTDIYQQLLSELLPSS